MFTRLITLCFTIPALMSAQEVSNVSTLRPWVQSASIIYARLHEIDIDIPVHSTMNVMDIKKRVRRDYGIPTEHQEIHPYWKRWWTLWLTEGHGLPLRNEESVKKTMSTQNTNLFEIHDTRRSQK